MYNGFYKHSRNFKRPSRALEDVNGGKNHVLNLSPYLSWPTRASETYTMVKIRSQTFTVLKQACKIIRDFYSGENYVYKLSRYLNRPARASQDFYGG